MMHQCLGQRSTGGGEIIDRRIETVLSMGSYKVFRLVANSYGNMHTHHIRGNGGDVRFYLSNSALAKGRGQRSKRGGEDDDSGEVNHGWGESAEIRPRCSKRPLRLAL
jgi:hypothetical protein